MAEQRQNAINRVRQLNEVLNNSLPQQEQSDRPEKEIRELQRNCANYIQHTINKTGRELWPLLYSISFTDLKDLESCTRVFIEWNVVLADTYLIQDRAMQSLQLVLRKQFSAYFAFHIFIGMLYKVCTRCTLQLSEVAPAVHEQNIMQAQNGPRQVALNDAQQLVTQVGNALQRQQFVPEYPQALSLYNAQRVSLGTILQLLRNGEQQVWPLLEGVAFVDIEDLDDATIVLNNWRGLLNRATDTLESMEDCLCLVVQKQFEAFCEMQGFINQLRTVIARIVARVGVLAQIAQSGDE